MKKMKRLSEPDSFFKGERKIKFYLDLRDGNGKIRDRWNLPTYKDDLRKRLLEMSDFECAYCGKLITDSDMDIEHFFPKESFPYLSYCFDNYLPSCKQCNQNVKKSFYPESLEDKKNQLSEELLVGRIENLVKYEKDKILNDVEDRIIEPSFDDINEHLEFIPEAFVYTAKTEIGEITNRTFFKHSEFRDQMAFLSDQIHKNMENQKMESKEDILGWAKLNGYSFYFEKFYEYWKEILSLKEFDETEHL